MKKITDKKELRDLILAGNDLSDIDYSEITDMGWMFDGCPALKTVPLFDTSRVTNMRWMFKDCSALETVPLFDTSRVTNMRWMFNGCSALKTIPLFDTSMVTDMRYMFKDCSALEIGEYKNELKVCFQLGILFVGCQWFRTPEEAMAELERRGDKTPENVKRIERYFEEAKK